MILWFQTSSSKIIISTAINEEFYTSTGSYLLYGHLVILDLAIKHTIGDLHAAKLSLLLKRLSQYRPFAAVVNYTRSRMKYKKVCNYENICCEHFPPVSIELLHNQ